MSFVAQAKTNSSLICFFLGIFSFHIKVSPLTVLACPA